MKKNPHILWALFIMVLSVTNANALTKMKVSNPTETGMKDCHGLVMVEVKDSLYGIIDSNGYCLIPPVYKGISRSECLETFEVEKDKDVHIYSIKYWGLHWVKKPNNKYIVEDNNFKRILGTEFDSLKFSMPQGTAMMKSGKDWGYMDTLGKYHQDLTDYEKQKHENENQKRDEERHGDFQIQKHYKEFYGECYTITKNGKVGLADSTFNIVIPIEYDSLIPYIDAGIILVQKGEKHGIITFANNAIAPIDYDQMKFYPELGKSIVKKNNKFGIVGTREGVIQTCKFDSIGILDKKITKRVKRQVKHSSDFDDYIIEEIGSEGSIKSFGVFACTMGNNEDPFYYYDEYVPCCFIVKSRGHRYIFKEDGVTIKAKEIFDWQKYQYKCIHADGKISAYNENGDYIKLRIADKCIVPENIHKVDYDKNSDSYIVGNLEYKKGVLNKKGETVVPIEYDDIKVNDAESEYVCFKKGKEVKRIHFK